MTSPTYHEYAAWDVPTRWFHWINALSVIGLIATGLVILNDDALGLSSGGKILLKGIHVSLGYAMAVNLIWRSVWAFFGNRYTGWRGILPPHGVQHVELGRCRGRPAQQTATRGAPAQDDQDEDASDAGRRRRWARDHRFSGGEDCGLP